MSNTDPHQTIGGGEPDSRQTEKPSFQNIFVSTNDEKNQNMSILLRQGMIPTTTEVTDLKLFKQCTARL